MEEERRQVEGLEGDLGEGQQAYVENLGIFFERFGFPRTVGRVLGCF